MKFLRIPLVVALLGAGMNTQAAPLDLDTGFDNDGILSANYGSGTNSFFQDVEATPDEKIVAIGHAQKTDATYDLLLVKYNIDGTLDSNFGTNGKINLPVEVNARGIALAVQPDGKLLVVGHSLGSNNKWGVYVRRFNKNGSEDANFTPYSYKPNFTHLGQSGPRNAFAKDIALTANGKIIVSLNEDYYTAQTGSGVDTIRRSRLFRLNENGGLDTAFGTSGLTVTSGDALGTSTSFSYEDENISLSPSGEIYVAGGRRKLFYNNHLQTMRLSKYSANGARLNFSGGNEGWVRRANTTAPAVASAIAKDRLHSSLVMPNSNVVSVGCFQTGTYFASRIQQQDSAGNFINAFNGNGVISSNMSTSSQRIEHCYRDVNYHPSVGIIAVGGIKNGSFTNHGSLYVSAVNDATGANIATERFGTVDEGYLLSTTLTKSGKIVSVGYMNNPRESVIVVMEGAALPASNPALGAISFADATGVALSTQQNGTANSNLVITPSAALTAHVFDGAATVNSLPVSNPFTVNDGDSLSLGHTSAATHNTEVTTGVVINSGAGFHRNNRMWKVGDTFSSFSSTTFSIDTTPDAFSFSPVLNVARNNMVQSAAITVTGINTPAAISVSSGSQYSINGGAYTNASGTVDNTDSVVVRHTSASGFSSDTRTTLIIGGVSGAFISTTEVQDTTPDAFSFTANTAVDINAVQTSSAITIAGINSATPISIDSGSYSINSGAYTSSAGMVNAGDVVTVRHTSSSSFSTDVTNTLTVGGVSAGFTSTTEVQDTTPDAFSFSAKAAVRPSTVQVFTSITVAGINSATPISVSGGGAYSISSGSASRTSFTSAPGMVNNGDIVTVRHTSSSNFSTAVTSALTIGGVSANFVSTTEAQDTTPTPFSFGLINGVQALNTTLISPQVSITGINSAAPISVTNGEYSINGGAFTSANGTISNGQNVRVRQITAGTFSTQKTTTLNVGGVFANFLSTTVAQDTTPDSFNFGPRVNDQQRGIQITSGSITVAGINSAAAISITGGEYQINNGSFTAANGTVNVGDTVVVRQTTASNFSSLQRAELTIGGVSSTFETRTEDQDIIPDALAVVAQTGVELSTVVTSAEITVTGINASTAISIQGGEYSLNGAAFTAAAGTLENGDKVVVRHTSSSSHSTDVSTEITVGTVVAIFKSTTKAVDAPVTTNPAPTAGGGGGGSMGSGFLLLATLMFLRRRGY